MPALRALPVPPYAPEMDAWLLRKPLEDKIASATGLEVKLGSFRVSPIGASLELGDITLAAPDAPADRPLLTIARLRAELSLRMALRGELRIRNIAIDRPVLSLHRDGSGKLNVLARPTVPTPKAAERPPQPPVPAREKKGSPLSVVIDRAVLVGGQVRYRDDAAPSVGAGVYHLALAGLSAELERSGDRYAFTAFADSVGRVDAPSTGERADVNLGRLRLGATLDHARDLAQLDEASLRAEAVLGDEASPIVRAAAESARLAGKAVCFTLDAALQAATLALFAPRPLPLPIRGLTGELEIRARGDAGLPARFDIAEFAFVVRKLRS